jgi:proton-coupled amino acid transporter
MPRQSLLETIPARQEDPEVVKRHLVQGKSSEEQEDAGPSRPGLFSWIRGESPKPNVVISDGPDLDDFSSLQLQGGDITREVYKWAAEADSQNETLDIRAINAPGGLRRDFLRRSGGSPEPRGTGEIDPYVDRPARPPARPLTNNFIEFLSLYGHFAGEELEDEDDTDDYFNYDADARDFSDEETTERSTLLTPRTPGGRKKKLRPVNTQGDNGSWAAALLLLKSFVGTGVLFLPKAFLNGGMLFSNLVLLGVAGLSYYCFILLVNTRLKVEGSFGDIGGILYGKWLRNIILASIVLSQIGFVAAYIVFTSQNLQAFILAVSKCKTWIDIKYMVMMQLIIFLPLSLVRDISKLGGTALIADVFILLGLIYLYYFDIATLAVNGGADYVQFNANDWTLFIGTAIFTFEGIGLIIPIQETMKKPQNFPRVLAIVMVIITSIFVSMGALSYAAFGSNTRTVVLLNLPQDDKFVNAVQFLYSLAILLSTPLQLFPAIRILENEIFTKSGKFSRRIKWKKNIFRFCLVIFCALIAWGGAGDLDKFVALVGSFACVPLVYVYPVSVPLPDFRNFY